MVVPLIAIRVVMALSPSDTKSFYEKNAYSITGLLFLLNFSTTHTGFLFRPVQERKTKMRFYLKNTQVGGFDYWVSFFLGDYFLCFFIITIAFTFTFLSLGDISSFNLSDSIAIIAFINIWLAGFISQNYLLSLMFDSEQTAVQYGALMNTLIMMMAILAFIPFPIASWFGGLLSPTGCCVLMILQNSAGKNQDLKKVTKLFMGLETSMLIGVLSSLFYLLVVVWIDSRKYRTGIKPYKSGKEVEVREEFVLDEESILVEKNKANQREAQFPIKVISLSKIFQKKKEYFFALKEINLVLEENQVLGILGPNGAGKSTTFNLLNGFLQRTGGEIMLSRISIENNPDFHKEVGMCLQDDIFWPELSVKENIQIMSLCRGTNLTATSDWLKILELSESKNKLAYFLFYIEKI